MLNFRECTLLKLEKTFGIEQVKTSPALEDWLNGQTELSAFERQALLTFREKLLVGFYDWNEAELAYNFIGPVLALVDYTTKKCNFFVERPLSGVVEGVEMGGEPDGIIASGFREPETPYFCLHEYKKEKDPKGDPAAQALAAMLVAQALNQHHHPVYGCYVKGRDWCFMTLEAKQYTMSQAYIATRDDVFDIFRILKVLKQKILAFVEDDSKSPLT